MPTTGREQYHLASLPLPIAQTLRRSVNAKSPEGSHLAAYYFFESTLKLAAASQVGVYIQAGCPDSGINGLLEDLTRPAVGHWLVMLRRVSKYLAGRKDAGLLPLSGMHERLVSRDPRPAAKAFLDFSARLHERIYGRTSLSVLDLFEVIVEYRNRELGHGAQRPRVVYEEGGGLLVEAVLESIRDLRPFEDLVLAVARDLVDPKTEKVARSYEALRGDGIHLALEEGEDSSIPAGQVVLVGKGTMISLHPLVVYEVDELDRDRVGFLNRVKLRRGHGEEGVRRVEYLDYDSGEHLESHDARAEVTEFLSKLRGSKVSVSEVDELSRGEEAVEEGEEPSRGEWIGDFELLGELGRGGMAIVYRARQASLGRIVALKVLSPGMAGDPVAVARFKREVAALGRCDHPNVVKVLTAGRAGPHYYYAMEFVEGCDLTGIYDVLSSWKAESGGKFKEGHLIQAISTSSKGRSEKKTDEVLPSVEKITPSVPEFGEGKDYYVRIAELLSGAARGVQHLHEHGIIHRDIKPGNIMVTVDGKRAVVMDLGIARIADHSQSLTATSVKILGTLRYMPPEQLQRSLLEVTHLADVYSLGATLYELVGLAPIHDGETEERLIKQVLQEEPIAPRRQNPAVPRDLESIATVATAKLPAERYQSAQTMAEDLRAFAKGEPIRVRPLGAFHYLKLAYRRHRTIANLLAVFFLVLLSIGVGAYYRVIRERDRALDAERVAEEREFATRKSLSTALAEKARLEYINGNTMMAKVYAAASLKQAENPEARGIVVASTSSKHPMPRWQSRPGARCYELAYSSDGSRLSCAAGDRILYWDMRTGREIGNFKAHDGLVSSIAFSPKEKMFATGSYDRTVKLWDLSSGNVVASLTGHDDGVTSVVFSPDGEFLASASMDKTIRLWDVASRGEVALLKGHKKKVKSIAFSPDGRRLASGSLDNTVRLWDLKTGKETNRFTGHGDWVHAVAFSPDGEFVASGGWDGTVRLWDLTTMEECSQIKTNVEWVNTVAFSRDGGLLAYGGEDGVVVLWNLDKGKEAKRLVGHNGAVSSIAFSPDGRTMASSGRDVTVRIWDLAAGREVAHLAGHDKRICSAVFSPDGRNIASGGGDGAIHVYDSASGEETDSFSGHEELVSCVAFSPDGKTIASGSEDATVRLWDLSTGKESARFYGHEKEVTSVAFSPNGKTLASASWEDRTLRIWDLPSGGEAASLKGNENTVAFSPDGKVLASGSWDERVRLWNPSSGKNVMTLSGDMGSIDSIDFSPDGKILALGSRDKTVKLWDLSSKKEVVRFLGHTGWVDSVSFSPDGKALASSGWDRDIRIWSLSSKKEVHRLTGHSDRVTSVDFSPDGTSLASASEDRTVRLWDMVDAQEKKKLAGHSDGVLSVAFSPDGGLLATGGDDATVRVWDLTSGKKEAILTGHVKGVRSVVFSPDGRTIVSGSDDATFRLWDVGAKKEIALFVEHERPVRAVAFSPDGKTVVSGSADKTIRLWDLATGKEKARFEDSIVLSVVFSPDGKTIVSAGLDGTIRVWDVGSGKETSRLPKKVDRTWVFDVSSLAFSPDGKVLASACIDRTLRLWDVVAGEEIARLTEPSEKVSSVAFSPDGRVLAASYDDSSIRLWDVGSRKMMARLYGHDGSVECVAFSPDGRILASGSEDKTVRLWDLNYLHVPGDGLLDRLEEKYRLQYTGEKVVPDPELLETRFRFFGTMK